MKGADYTTKIMNLTNDLVREQNAHNATALDLDTARRENQRLRRILAAYEGAGESLLIAHPELSPEYDQALNQALAEAQEHKDNEGE